MKTIFDKAYDFAKQHGMICKLELHEDCVWIDEIHREQAPKGHGKLLLDIIHQIAEPLVLPVRLNAFVKPTTLTEYYEKLGYVQWPNADGFMVTMEKIHGRSN